MKGNERGKEREREERTEKKKMGYTGKEGDSGVRGKGNEEEEEEETSIRRKRRRKGGGKEEGSATFSKFRSWGVNFSILAGLESCRGPDTSICNLDVWDTSVRS